MKTSIADISDVRKSIQFTFEPELLQSTEQTILGKIAKKVRVPGFRPGKAPVDLVRQQYAEYVATEFNNALIDLAIQNLEAELKLPVYAVTDAKVQIQSVREPQSLTLIVDLQPTFTLPNYLEIPIEAKKVTVTDEDVTQTLNQILKERASFVVVQRPAQQGDYVQLAYQGHLDGVALALSEDMPAIYAGQKITWEEAGAPEDTPTVRAISDALVGMQAGDSKEVTMHFPADFKVPALADKSVSYSIQVDEVRHKEMPELDEAFFKSIQVSGLEELNKNIRHNLEREQTEAAEFDKRTKVIEYLDASTEMNVPESAELNEAQILLDDIVARFTSKGMPEKWIHENKEKLIGHCQEDGRKRAKLSFLITKIAQAEKIELTSNDLQQALFRSCMMLKKKPDQYIKELQKTPGKLKEFRHKALTDKTLDFLVQKANITFV